MIAMVKHLMASQGNLLQHHKRGQKLPYMTFRTFLLEVIDFIDEAKLGVYFGPFTQIVEVINSSYCIEIEKMQCVCFVVSIINEIKGL